MFVVPNHVLLHDDRVRSLWNRRTGKNADTFARAYLGGVGFAGERRSNDGEHVVLMFGDVGMTQGVAIHGGIWKRLKVKRRIEIDCQDPA